MRRAWIVIGGSAFGSVVVPVDIIKCGPKKALVRLLRKAKLPTKNGGIWRESGHQTWAPSWSVVERCGVAGV